MDLSEPIGDSGSRRPLEELAERISSLDKESQSLLFLLSVSAFNEWQDAYLDAYRHLLELREKNKVPIDEYEANLYTLLLETQKQRTVLQTYDKLQTTQTSYLRTIWRAYRVEMFVKALLIIFLLKLPYFCYIIAVVFYILYCFGVIAYVVRIAKIVRDHKSTQNFYRRLRYILNFIEPLLLSEPERSDDQDDASEGTEENDHPSDQREEATPENAPADNDTGHHEDPSLHSGNLHNDSEHDAPEGTVENEEDEPIRPTVSTINLDEEKPEAAHRRRWTVVAEELEKRATRMNVHNDDHNEHSIETHSDHHSGHPMNFHHDSGGDDQPVTPLVERTVVYKVSEPGDAPADDTPEGDPATQDVVGDSTSVTSPTPSGGQSERTKKRQKPSETEKVLYQLFASFVLSLLPWWEPNPNYL